MDKGAHFYRTDFQVHSARDLNWTGCKPVTNEKRMALARAFIQACRERGLQAVGITDHHDVCFLKYFQLAAQEGKTDSAVPTPSAQDPIIFPGVELTLKVPCQAIVLLDAEADSSIQAMLLEAVGIGNTYPDESADGPQVKVLSFKSMKDLDNALRSYSHGALKGRYIILPHVGDDGSHKTLLREGFDPEYASMPCVGGYIECDWDSHKKQHILTGTTTGWGPRAIGVFQTSDSRREDFRDLGCRTTWVKMAEPTAEALRQACLARESRLFQEQPELPARYISRIEVSNSTFMGAFDVELNPQFNAIIGGRGTGKSTILEYLRWAMQDQPVPYESDLEHSDGVTRKRRLIQDTLETVKGSVTIYWVVDGTNHVVHYDSGSREITLQVGSDEPVSVTAEKIRELLPIRAYSQKQLSSVSNRTAELQRFIEQPIREQLADFEKQIKQKRQQIASIYESILARRQIERDLASTKTTLASLKERAASIEKSLPKLKPEYDKAIKEHAARLREEQAVETLNEDMEAAKELINDAVRGLAELPQALSLAENSPQKDMLQQHHAAASEAIKKVIDDLTGSEATLALEMKNIAEDLKKWKANHELHRRAYESAQEKTDAHKKQMSQLRDLRNQEAETQKTLNELERRLKNLSEHETEFAALLDSWIELHRQRGNALQKQCEKLTELSNGEIRAELVRGADMDRAIEALKETVKGAHISQDKWKALRDDLLAKDGAVENWKSLMLELRGMAEANVEDLPSGSFPKPLKCWDLTEKQRLAIVEKLQPKEWLNIALTSLKDLPRFYYKTDKGEIPFEQASAGQQATALLRALLQEGGGPLIIDQPEEDLDNAVIHKIVTLIWKAKQTRQIIFASHNANLVVNGDAELVVHCDYASEHNRSKGKIKNLGAIDVDNIREVITNVMEGGERAFKLRKQKYGF